MAGISTTFIATGTGNRHNLTLPHGLIYTVYAQTTNGDSVSSTVTYKVG